MFKRHFHPRSVAAFGALFAGAIALASGCSSSPSSPNSASGSQSAGASGGQGGSESGEGVGVSGSAPIHRDASAILESDTGTASNASNGMYDGTVGQSCKADSDCQPAGGPGVNTCSLSLNPAAGPIFASAFCITRSCDPGSDGNLHFCDGPDDITMDPKGVCLATGPGSGICLPLCLALVDGSAPTGCLPGDACAPLEFATDSQTGDIAAAIGFCTGGCVADSDCPTGSHCQVDQGSCLDTVTPPTKPAGAPCTQADTTSGACNCVSLAQFSDGGAAPGVCAPFCVTGPTTGCPSGFVCDALLQTTLEQDDAALVAGFTKNNPGLGGECFQACAGAEAGSPAGEAGASSADGGAAAGACPGTLTCATTETVGADCLPL